MAISSGDDKIDMALSNGFTDNSIMSLFTPLGSDMEIALHQLIEGNPEKNIVYVTVDQSEAGLKRSFNRRNILDDATPQIEDLSSYANPMNELKSKIELFPDDSIIIIDSINKFENMADEKSFEQLFSEIYTTLQEKNIFFLFYGFHNESENVIRNLIKRNSDIICNLKSNYDSNDKVLHMEFAKLRGSAPKDERINVVLREDKLTVDASRGIS